MPFGEVNLFRDDRGSLGGARRVFAHVLVALYRASRRRKTAGTAHAGVLAAVHFEEEPREGVDFFQHFAAAVHPVHGDVFVARGQRVEGLDYAARNGIIARFERAFLLRLFCLYFAKVDVFLCEKSVQILECENSVDDSALVRLAFFCDARSDEHYRRVGISLFEHTRVRHHRGGHGREIFQRLGIVELYHPVDCGAGGSDEVLEAARRQQSGVFLRDRLCAHRGFFHDGKAEHSQRLFHYGEVLHGKTRHERGRKARDDPTSAFQQGGDGVRFAVHLFRVLRAHQSAFAAEYAALLDDFRLVVLVAYRLDGALTQTLEAVLALGVLEIQIR